MATPSSTPHDSCDRIILLLDLDCFYVQCEAIRLGLDCSSLPVCLLQWDSALAVSYPARAMGIKRGDGFDEIRRKSNGNCVALHLPIMSVAKAAGKRAGSGVGGDFESLKQSYASEYELTADVRKELLKRERNRMRRPSEGKADLERYRLASAMIFSVIGDCLEKNVGKGRYILERASIDEIFLDVTDHCKNMSAAAWGDGLQELAAIETVETIIFGSERSTARNGDRKHKIVNPGTNDDSTYDGDSTYGGSDCHGDDAELWRGCILARGIRKAVYDALGFTMSAGISVNKLVAKLGASYGKPNGQAVVHPRAIPHLMDVTPIRKARNMGGKMGKVVQSLLPSEKDDRMGSIRRNLSLHNLVAALGHETGRRVFDLARGLDHEPVQKTAGALTKSITSFKSFGATNLLGMGRWIVLLATDVVARVELDTRRNERRPKTCNIQYCYVSGGGQRITRSARVHFPRGDDRHQRVDRLVSSVTDTLTKHGNFPIQRLGLAAIDFEAQRNRGGAIDSFFCKTSPSSLKAVERLETGAKDSNCSVLDGGGGGVPDPLSAREVDLPHQIVATEYAATREQNRSTGLDRDLEYARTLQASFDREETLLVTLDRSIKKRKTSSNSSRGGSKRIDSFFGKK